MPLLKFEWGLIKNLSWPKLSHSVARSNEEISDNKNN